MCQPSSGHRWREQHNRFRPAPVAGRLVVTRVGDRWAKAKFEAGAVTDNGTFVTTWDGAFFPSSDPCGY